MEDGIRVDECKTWCAAKGDSIRWQRNTATREPDPAGCEIFLTH